MLLEPLAVMIAMELTKYSITSRSEFSKIAIPTEPVEQTIEPNIESVLLRQGNKSMAFVDT